MKVKIRWLFTLILLVAFAFNLQAPLQGVHTIRQSDTTFASYSYCIEKTEFLKPKVAHRGATSGTAIGEFPLYSYLMSLPCQLRGSWSELDPKFLILLLWILNMMVWLAWAKIYLKPHEPSAFGVLLGFSTFSLLFMTIALPDNLGFFLIGLAAFLHQRFPQKKISILTSLLFILAFAIRPYLIPLILLVHRRWLWMLLTTFGCLLVYVLWYKFWVQQSELNYYYLAIPPISEIFATFPNYAVPLFKTILREWFQFVFIFLLVWKWRSLKALEVFGVFGSLALVILVRGEHLVIHSYYLWAAAVFTFLCLFRALMTLSKKQQAVALIGYGIIGFAQTQHEFHRQAFFKAQEVQNILQTEKIPADAKIAVYVGDGSCSTQYLYWMKHFGWCFYEKDFKGPDHCPKGADYYFKYDMDLPILKPCESVPTDKPTDK